MPHEVPIDWLPVDAQVLLMLPGGLSRCRECGCLVLDIDKPRHEANHETANVAA